MAQQLGGMDHWEVRFDAAGKLVDAGSADTMLREIDEAGIADVLVFSHGWNNDSATARRLYERFFEVTGDVLRSRGGDPATVGTVGVLWPSMRWADEDVPGARAGAAGLGDDPADADLVAQLGQVFDDPAQQAALAELARLLEERPADAQALNDFQQQMRTLVEVEQRNAPEGSPTDVESETAEAPLLDDDPQVLFSRFGSAAAGRREEGAAGLLDGFGKLWNGAKEALRQLTYWQMKNRAGVVGQHGLGPLLGRLHAASSPRLHLIGHSFGARLVSFSLAGLPQSALQNGSPVRSLTLLQAAFSHFAFADALPHDPNRSGALKGMAKRVDGPILVTHTLYDTAVGKFYPLASLSGRQDAAGAGDALYRWGALGNDGAQAVNAVEATLGAVGTAYRFSPGGFVNLDANNVIRTGRAPSGAHSDILHPQIAWALAAGAGLIGAQR